MIERVMPVLWEMTLTATWAAGLVFLARLLLKKRAPRRVICLLWLVVFARLLVPVSLKSPLSLVPPALSGQERANRAEVSAPVSPVIPQAGAGTVQPAPFAQTAGTAANSQPAVTAPALPENAPAAPAGFPIMGLLAGIWLAGAAGMLGCGLVSCFRLRRRVRFAVRVAGRVWEDETVASPFILGLFRPKIYLPAGLEGRARRFILCHEFAHLRRFDHVVKPLCWLALALHWFNPAVWAAFLLLGRDMEAACDEAVLRCLGEEVKADYSYTLLALATGGRIPAPCPVAFDEGDAKGRVKNVLDYRRPALWIVAVSVLAVVVAAVCLLTDPVADHEPSDPPPPSESEPGPAPSGEPSQNQDESLNALLDPWMLAVLNGERAFSLYDTDRDIGHLAEAFYNDYPPENLELTFTLAILDLDQDGAKELILCPEGAHDNTIVYTTGYMILRQEGDAIRGYAPGWRSIGNLKADGTFSWSGSAAYDGTGRARFEGGEFLAEQISWVDNGSYFVDGQPATEAEFNAAIEDQNAKPDPVWYTFENGVLTDTDEAWKNLVGVGCTPFVSIPVDPAENIYVPSFLSDEQKSLYQKAHSLYSHMFGAATSAIDEWQQGGSEQLPPAQPVEVDGYTYTPSTGQFAQWADLEAAALSVFTPELFQERNTWLDNDGNPHQTFLNVDGRTYYIDAARGSYGTNPYFPDTFHLPEQSETEITFVLTGHYSEVWPLEGESEEEREERLKANWETYIGFPMKLVLTQNGWRFARFHVSSCDDALLPYANQAAPNPALTDDPEPAGGACVHGLDHIFIDHPIDGRLLYRCMEDFFPYYPPYPCAYSSESIAEGDYDGDGHLEQVVRNSAGTLMLCDVVPLDGQPVYGGKNGEMKTFTFDLRALTDAYPDADLSTMWIEPGDALIVNVPRRPSPDAASTGTVELHLRYDGERLTEELCSLPPAPSPPAGPATISQDPAPE